MKVQEGCKLVLAIVAFTLVPGCAHDLKFKAFGEYRPDLERKVMDTYTATQKDQSTLVPRSEVRVYMGTFPPGVKYENGVISVLPESERIVIGTFEWMGGGHLPKDGESGGELAKIAKAAGGNELVLINIKNDRGYTRSAEGIVILYHPRNKTPFEEKTSDSI
jgi:hypothetical protein